MNCYIKLFFTKFFLFCIILPNQCHGTKESDGGSIRQIEQSAGTFPGQGTASILPEYTGNFPRHGTISIRHVEQRPAGTNSNRLEYGTISIRSDQPAVNKSIQSEYGTGSIRPDQPVDNSGTMSNHQEYGTRSIRPDQPVDTSGTMSNRLEYGTRSIRPDQTAGSMSNSPEHGTMSIRPDKPAGTRSIRQDQSAGTISNRQDQPAVIKSILPVYGTMSICPEYHRGITSNRPENGTSSFHQLVQHSAGNASIPHKIGTGTCNSIHHISAQHHKGENPLTLSGSIRTQQTMSPSYDVSSSKSIRLEHGQNEKGSYSVSMPGTSSSAHAGGGTIAQQIGSIRPGISSSNSIHTQTSSFSIRQSCDSNSVHIHPRIELYAKNAEYNKIESFANHLNYDPEQNCPCGNDKLQDMVLAYFQWTHPKTCEEKPARYLISKTFLNEGTIAEVFHATAISYPENGPHECVAIKLAKENEHEISLNEEFKMVASFRGAHHIIGYGPLHHYYKISSNDEFHTVAEEKGTIIVMEIGQDFRDYWEEQTEDNRKEIMLKVLKQILIGIDEMHQKNIVHLDLKTNNFLRMPSKNNEIYLKLIDFGSAIKLENGQKKKVDVRDLITTPQFTAPEINEPKIYSKFYTIMAPGQKKITKVSNEIMISEKADIWSFGMIILDLFSFSSKTEIKNPMDFFTTYATNHLNNNKKLNEAFEIDLEKFLIELEMENVYSPQITGILKNCLKWKPEERPSAKELIERYFNKISSNQKNVNFFGEMTKYLERQFNQISMAPMAKNRFKGPSYILPLPPPDQSSKSLRINENAGVPIPQFPKMSDYKTQSIRDQRRKMEELIKRTEQKNQQIQNVVPIPPPMKYRPGQKEKYKKMQEKYNENTHSPNGDPANSSLQYSAEIIRH